MTEDLPPSDREENTHPDEVAEPEFIEPETAESESAEPQAEIPEAVEPESAEPDAALPDTGDQEATEPEPAEPEAENPDALESDAALPDTGDQEATEPEAAEPEATEPEAAEPEVEDVTAKRVFPLDDPVQRRYGITKAKSAIARGRLVVMPTDTVYGVAADAFDPAGVRRLLRAKGRGRKVPSPVLIGSLDTLRALATGLSPEARELTREFWPGGLTLICRQQPSLHWDLGDSRGTVALRMPDHADALAFLEDTGPLAVSSANKHGDPPATTIDEARKMLGESVEVYLDSGPTPGPVASTILDATGETLRLVREGVISVERLREVIPEILDPDPED